MAPSLIGSTAHNGASLRRVLLELVSTWRPRSSEARIMMADATGGASASFCTRYVVTAVPVRHLLTLAQCLYGCTPFFCDNRQATKTRIIVWGQNFLPM